jgi:transposase-like protein
VRVKGRWASLYRAIDEDGQVGDVLLREHRDLASARACFAEEVITDGHQAYRRATKEPAPAAVYTVTGLHRAPGHETTQPIKRSPGAVQDRLRPMRGLQSAETGQRRAEGPQVPARRLVATDRWLAGERRWVS